MSHSWTDAPNGYPLANSDGPGEHLDDPDLRIFDLHDAPSS
jgi:hypothetical protein